MAALKSIGMTEVTSVLKQIGTHASILFLVPPLMPVIIPVLLIDK